MGFLSLDSRLSASKNLVSLEASAPRSYDLRALSLLLIYPTPLPPSSPISSRYRFPFQNPLVVGKTTPIDICIKMYMSDSDTPGCPSFLQIFPVFSPPFRIYMWSFSAAACSEEKHAVVRKFFYSRYSRNRYLRLIVNDVGGRISRS